MNNEILGSWKIVKSKIKDNEYEATFSCSSPEQWGCGGIGSTPLKAMSKAFVGLSQIHSHKPLLLTIP